MGKHAHTSVGICRQAKVAFPGLAAIYIFSKMVREIWPEIAEDLAECPYIPPKEKTP